MPPPFKQVTREQFAELLGHFDFKRNVDAVHMHHTWRPNHSHYDPADGHRSILGMYLHHTQVKHWQDIAQHLTIAPDGTIWLGRSWNLPPASAAGHNGNLQFGPFMLEVIGNFDVGRDRLEGAQRDAVIDVIAQVQHRFDLGPETLRFHNAMSAKPCPGSSIDRAQVVKEVRARRKQITRPDATLPEAPRSPFPPEAEADVAAVQEALAWMGHEVLPYIDPADAEPEYGDEAREVLPQAVALAGERGSGLTPSQLAALRPHLVNLNGGRFSSDGDWDTDQGDVDALFDRDLELALQAAEQEGRALRIVFFAHGGLVKESSGLEIAHKHLAWWQRNHVYPIYFVWETGLFETLGQLLARALSGARNFVSDHVTDPLIETIAHDAGGVMTWSGMQFAARLASATPESVDGEGGAHYVVRKLKAFCERHTEKAIELHAVGHSAGSIFLAHFLDAASTLGVPSFKSMHFLAPAIRVDLFRKLVENRIGAGKGVDRLCLFTMYRDFERDDHCARIYRKSLLYLIYYALEPERKEPILGLEECLRRDASMRTLFGLDSPRVGDAEVVFSRSPTDNGRSASLSTTHGGFDDDAATMNSVLRRILGKADADTIEPYSMTATAEGVGGTWFDQVDWPERQGGEAIIAVRHTGSAFATGDTRVTTISPKGRRCALCVGINHYSSAPLNGCIADAEEWADTFRKLGFESIVMCDAEATHESILRRLGEMLASSTAGDVLVFQFAGHGTQLPDLNGDESDGKDEAMVPYDYASGAYLIDDDVRELFSGLPDGVNLTCFFDCCHSGTNTRFAIGTEGLAQRSDERRRFLVPSVAMQEAHAAFRRRLPASRKLVRSGPEKMRNIAFSACLPYESAWESNGHGDYTVRATRLLRAGIQGMTNEQFNQRIVADFGPGARQRPMLDCAPAAILLGLLAPLTVTGSHSTSSLSPALLSDIKATLQSLLGRLDPPN
ncbi:caspase family protein [Vreelandella rituensis]|uniref:Peptidase C14 n=1 Tax=Vreelandella rituensis TaxID=2282306 RepID=A0A368TPK8_9GAMM|nr:caspase family protein [Halomonas rituensis]RCV86659.1 peptidase C14 [Halomonas rituensis]